MKLKNKKTGKVITVSDARWARIKKYKRDHLYTVEGQKEIKKVNIENLRKPAPKVEEPKVEEPKVWKPKVQEKKDDL